MKTIQRNENQRSMGEVRLLLSPPRSGKTTVLLAYLRKEKTAGGWVCPDVSTWRMLVEFPNENWRPFQSEPSEDTYHIGRFHFRKPLFDAQWKRFQNLQLQTEPTCTTWVIDEVGPLELRQKEGWSLVLDELFQLDLRGKLNFNLVVVVRLGYESAFQQRWPFKHIQLESLDQFSERVEVFETSSSINQLSGLVLAGGNSSRMGQNKALLPYEGHPLYRRTALMLSPFCRSVYLSVHPNVMSAYPDWPCLYDDLNLSQQGPLTALLSAWKNFPRANWLLLACDYPKLDSSTIQLLISSWQTDRPIALCSSDQRANPMFAIYPASSYQELKKFYEKGGQSLRLFLEAQNSPLITSINAPISVDTPQIWHDVTGQELPNRPL